MALACLDLGVFLFFLLMAGLVMLVGTAAVVAFAVLVLEGVDSTFLKRRATPTLVN